MLPPGDYDQKKLRPIVDMARQRIRDQEAKKAARKPSGGDRIVHIYSCNMLLCPRDRHPGVCFWLPVFVWIDRSGGHASQLQQN